MRIRTNLVAAAMGAAVCLLVICSLGGREQTYEVRPEIMLPEHRTDAARAIDAYERLMERYMDSTGETFQQLAADLRIQHNKLDCISAKLDELLVRTAGIEKSLGIENRATKPAVCLPADANSAGSKERQ